MIHTLDAALAALRLAARRLRRTPMFSITVVASLAIGIGLTGALFALVQGVLLRPLPYREADRLVVLRHEATRGELPMTGISPGLASYYMERSTTIDHLGVYIDRLATITDGGTPERTGIALVTPELFAALQPRTAAGRVLAASDYAPGGESRAMISHSLWVRRYNADRAIVGRTIEIDRNVYHVVGVAAPTFRFPSSDTQVWIAFGWPAHVASRASLRALGYGNVVRLTPGVTIEQARRELEQLLAALPNVFPDVTRERFDRLGPRVRVLPMKEALVGSIRIPLLFLLGSAGLLLLIAWANASNIMLVRAERARRDVVVSRALGASGGTIAAWFFGEGAVLAAGGGAVGLALTAVLVRVHFGFPPGGIPRLEDVTLGWTPVALVALLSAASAVLLGGIGFLATRRTRLVEALAVGNARMSGGPREQIVRQALVASQVALALTLLIGSGLMARSFWQLKQVPLGFAPTGAVTFRLPIPPGEYSSYHASARVHDAVLRRLRAVPGVAAAEAVHSAAFPLIPVPSSSQFRLRVAGQSLPDPEAAPWGRLGFATPGYFAAMRIPILKGRSFEWKDTGREEYGVILSASLAKALFGTGDPIGRHVRWARSAPDPDYVVVGVAGDVPGERISDGPSRAFYFPNLYPPKADTVTGTIHDYIPFDEVYVLRTQLAPATLLPIIYRVVQEVDPKLVVSRVSTLDQVVADSTARTRLAMFLLLAGAGAAMLLGVIGIYGTLSYAVTLRRSELGIRMALGASPGQVTSIVVREGATQAAAGVAIGLLMAALIGRYLRALLYGVSATDPVAFGAMAVLLFVVALAASYVPARRAGRIHPAGVLREG